MSITVEAVYESGVLKPERPLPLKEHEKVRITLDANVDWVAETYGLIGWTGDHDSLAQFALSPELDPQEGP
jgi:predicted DNA-binding antitoxin AbrB/MazE fold protein